MLEEIAGLYDFLNKSRHVKMNGLKTHVGSLSPGCLSCMAGEWACFYMNLNCTRRCFYCPIPEERRSTLTQINLMIDDISFNSIDTCIEYLKHFGFSGIAFSGGDPLLEFNRVVLYIRQIRDELEPECYIWLYTNGDPLTEEKLTELNAVGLNEIRFNLSENDYISSKLEMAVSKIPAVTIEIPAIPEDVNRLCAALKYYDKIGIKHINLNQISLNRNNQKKLAARGYTISNGTWVVDSELAALRVIQYVVDQELAININFCSQAYKHYIEKFSRKRRLG